MRRGAMRRQTCALLMALFVLVAMPAPAHSFFNLAGSSPVYKTDADLKTVLKQHSLQDAVGALERLGVYDLARLRLLADGDIDMMVERNKLPLITGRLLKLKRTQLIAGLEKRDAVGLASVVFTRLTKFDVNVLRASRKKRKPYAVTMPDMLPCARAERRHGLDG